MKNAFALRAQRTGINTICFCLDKKGRNKIKFVLALRAQNKAAQQKAFSAKMGTIK